jgi:hypothetical protein
MYFQLNAAVITRANITPSLILKGATFIITCALAHGGESPVIPVSSETNTASKSCLWLQGNPGDLYKNDSHPYIQEFGFFGRMHYQNAWIDGQSGNDDFWYSDNGELRRLRIGAKVKFFNHFSLEGRVNLVNDRRPVGEDLDLGYHSLNTAKLTFDAKHALPSG